MKKLIGSLLALVICFSVFAPAAHAATVMTSGQKVVLDKSEVTKGDYFAAGESVTISGTVNGDAYVAGSNIVVDGVINGDLLAAGSDIAIRGTVKGDIRTAGANVMISGKVGGNLTVGASKVIITNLASLGGSIVAGVGDLDIAAPVGKGITAGVGKLTLGSKVGGDLTYWSEQDLTMNTGATVSGVTTRHDVPKSEKRPEKAIAGALAGAAVGFKVMESLGLFLIGVIFLSLFPVYANAVIGKIKSQPWSVLLLGFAAVILMPVGALILLVTIVGMPLALLVFLAFIAISMFGKIVAALFAGNWLLSRFTAKPNPYGSLALGFVVFFVLALIPFLGWLAMGVLFLMAMGSLLLHHRDLYQSLRTKKLV